MTTAVETPARAEQSRARYPDSEGYVERAGVRIFYEVYGEGEHTILLLPTWSIIHSRHWKGQIPYLSRHFRVLTFDGRGNGRSDRPSGAEAYLAREFADDALAVMDATHTESALLVALSRGTHWATLLAADHADRVNGVAYIGSALPYPLTTAERNVHAFDEELDTDEGWAKFNRHYWTRDYRGFLEFFFSKVFSEPHSTKQIEDCVGWGLDTDAETLIDTAHAGQSMGRDEFREASARVRCPVLVIHGDSDQVRPHSQAAAFAEEIGGELVTLEGSGHCPHARDPVKVNLLLRDFAEPGRPAPRSWIRGRSRRRRALYVCSPIGLGHAQRDVAIAKELRRRVPDLEIDWLAQDPVTRVLDAEGERVHPLSRELANESRHFESESAEHDLHCFQAWRRMDEILLANFMVFHDLVSEENYDLWIGDEAWELDYYLHENPEQKRAAYVRLTDFVGWLPMEDGGDHEKHLTSDYNAEMIEHIARYPRVRDQALFVGNRDDVVADSFGADLPQIGDWTEQHFDFVGYVQGFDPAELLRDRRAACATGSAIARMSACPHRHGGRVGRRRRSPPPVTAAFPAAKQRVPSLRMVAGPRPRSTPSRCRPQEGLRGPAVRATTSSPPRRVRPGGGAAGLTTSMELTANGWPFLYFPLRHHFEQTTSMCTTGLPLRPGSLYWRTALPTRAPPPDVIAQAIAEGPAVRCATTAR